MKNWLSILLVITVSNVYSQTWVDTSYAIQTKMDITYGSAVTFAGRTDALKLDVSYPVNDTPPKCGRPLLIVVHGGAYIAGDKNEGLPIFFRNDFAKRGYVTASVNYRLGMFHTDKYNNCNVPTWNCINMTDSSEWYRANYRGMQDVKGAIRYMINHADDYNIDPNNVFIVGESAGGFIALSVGFTDDDSEVLSTLVDSMANAPTPNSLYENTCIKGNNLATSIASMKLERNNLGKYEGDLNQPASSNYTIRGVGSFYGGAYNNIFKSHGANAPGLYMFHQPCDLIVPFTYSKVFAGFNSCMQSFPTNCGTILNRPFIYGSNGIKNLIDSLVKDSLPTSDYQFDNGGKNYNCLQQTNSSMVCHATDNYWLRSSNMATYFATKMDTCTKNNSVRRLYSNKLQIQVYPNPSDGLINFDFVPNGQSIQVKIFNTFGVEVFNQSLGSSGNATINMQHCKKGIYYVFCSSETKTTVVPVVVE